MGEISAEEKVFLINMAFLRHANSIFKLLENSLNNNLIDEITNIYYDQLCALVDMVCDELLVDCLNTEIIQEVKGLHKSARLLLGYKVSD